MRPKRATIRPDVLDLHQRAAVARYLDRVVGSTFARSYAIAFIVYDERTQMEQRQAEAEVRRFAAEATTPERVEPVARLFPRSLSDFDDEVTAVKTMIGPAIGPPRRPVQAVDTAASTVIRGSSAR